MKLNTDHAEKQIDMQMRFNSVPKRFEASNDFMACLNGDSTIDTTKLTERSTTNCSVSLVCSKPSGSLFEGEPNLILIERKEGKYSHR